MMTIKQARNYLKPKIGGKIVIIYHGSRNKKEKWCGILLKLYYNIFTVKLSNGDIKSFSYIDILTKTIQIYV